MGKNLLETIQYFGFLGKIRKVRFRKLNTPLPHFAETFTNDGYMDIYKAMRAFRQVNFNGVIISGHVSQLMGDRAGMARFITFMKAYRQRASEEVGG